MKEIDSFPAKVEKALMILLSKGFKQVEYDTGNIEFIMERNHEVFGIRITMADIATTETGNRVVDISVNLIWYGEEGEILPEDTKKEIAEVLEVVFGDTHGVLH